MLHLEICSLNGQYSYANLMEKIQLHSFECQLMTEYWLSCFPETQRKPVQA